MNENKTPILPSAAERLLASIVDLQHYVTHDTDQTKCAACPRWDELQSAAVAMCAAMGGLESDLAALREENERLKEDAQRYRWLQSHTIVTGLARFTHRMGKQLLNEAVDANLRTDAALAAKEQA